MSSFTEALITRRDSNGKTWTVETEYDYFIGNEKSRIFARAYKGFVTDLASIPRIVQTLFPKSGKHDQAGATHDLGYKYNATFFDLGEGKLMALPDRDRLYWDKVFYEAMLVLGVSKWRAKLMYAGVRSFGWVAWANHRSKDRVHPLRKELIENA